MALNLAAYGTNGVYNYCVCNMSRGEERRRFSQTEQAEAHNSFAEEEEAETAGAIVCGFPPIPLRTLGVALPLGQVFWLVWN